MGWSGLRCVTKSIPPDHGRKFQLQKMPISVNTNFRKSPFQKTTPISVNSSFSKYQFSENTTFSKYHMPSDPKKKTKIKAKVFLPKGAGQIPAPSLPAGAAPPGAPWRHLPRDPPGPSHPLLCAGSVPCRTQPLQSGAGAATPCQGCPLAPCRAGEGGEAAPGLNDGWGELINGIYHQESWRNTDLGVGELINWIYYQESWSNTEIWG